MEKARQFFQDCLRPLIKSDPETMYEVKGILVREFHPSGVSVLNEAELKRFNGRAITVLRQRGLMQPPFGERA